jgi:hypothetical protein
MSALAALDVCQKSTSSRGSEPENEPLGFLSRPIRGAAMPNLNRTGEQGFRGSLAGLGSFAHCDFV